MAQAPTRDIVLTHARAYDHVVYLEDADTYTYSAHIRQDPTATAAPDAAFTIDTTTAVDGYITLSLEDTDTTSLVPKTLYRWDLTATDTEGRPFTLLQGGVTVLQDVTH